MPDIAPFHGLHLDPAKVDLTRALTGAPPVAPPPAAVAPPPAPADGPVPADRPMPSSGAAAAAPVADDASVADRRDPHDPARLLEPGGAALLDAWLTSGALVRDGSPSLYRYVQIGGPGPDGRPLVRRGLIAAVRLTAYSESRNQPHLRTVEAARERQLASLRATRLHATPMTAIYADAAGEVERLLKQIERERPLLEVTTPDGVRHQIWRTSNAELIGKIRRSLGPKKLILGEGHHRYEAMLAWQAELAAQAGPRGLAQYSAAQYATMALVEQHDPGLTIEPAHRLLVGLDGFDSKALLARAREYFLVDVVPNAARDGAPVERALGDAYGHQPAFVVVIAGEPNGWRFTLAPHVNLAALGIAGHPAVQRLEVTLIHSIVFERILGIPAAALEAGAHLRYPHSTAEALSAVERGEAQAGFLVPAVRLETIKHVVEVGDVMPARATRLGPPVAAGLVMRRVDVDEDLL